MRKCLLSLGLVFFVLLNGHSQNIVSVTSFGYEPGSRQNVVPFVLKALQACRKLKKPTLLFPKGRYDFWPQYCTEKLYYESNTDVIPLRTCAILVERFNGLTIDASGSDFIFHGRMQPFTIDSSRNIRIKNGNIDWDIPTTAQALISDVTNDYIDIEINAYESPYTIENDKLVFTGEGWKSIFWDAMEFDGKTRLIVPNTGDNCLGNNWQQYKAVEIKKGLVRLNYSFTRKPAAGNYLVLRHSTRDHAGMFIVNSKNVSLDHINMYHNCGLGILSQYSTNLFFNNVHCIPNAAKNRVLSGHDDGLHFSNCRGKIVVDSCSFAGLMDDPINVHGTSVRVIEKIKSNSLKCRFVHPQSIGFVWARPNENIALIENETMSRFATAKVVSFKALSPEDFEISFAAPLPIALEPGDALENLSWTPGVLIKNSYFGSNRARGILVSTPGEVIIENNVFESSGTAILIPGDANGWYESGAVKNVIIRNNIFKEACLSSSYQFCEGIISIYPEIPKPDVKKPFHSNIRIEHNEFNPFDYPVLYAKSTTGLVFSNNIIHHATHIAPWHSRKYMISLEKCLHAEVKRNTVDADVPGKNILLQQTDIKELETDITLVVEEK
jgi:hypothetical protein